MFDFFFYPERDDFMKQFLQCSIDIVKKRYGEERLLKDSSIRRVFHMLTTIEDDDARRFFLLFLMYWEQNVSDTIKSGIDDNEPIFSPLHYEKFRMRLKAFIDQTVHFPYDKHNIIEIVTEFEKAARLEYVMGPYHKI